MLLIKNNRIPEVPKKVITTNGRPAIYPPLDIRIRKLVETST
jgi:hypothetical protein